MLDDGIVNIQREVVSCMYSYESTYTYVFNRHMKDQKSGYKECLDINSAALIEACDEPFLNGVYPG